MTISRRRFLHHAASGSAVLTMPTFLQACGGATQERVITGAAPGTNVFAEWFGISQEDVKASLAALTQNGADQAELYFQHQRTSSIQYQDGIVASANTNVDQGVGLRCVVGDQTGYAFTEELSREAMVAAARTAASIARGSAVVAPEELRRRELAGQHYRVEVPWRDVGIDRKLPILRRAAEMAKRRDPAISKVELYWTDADERVLIADMHGNVHLDERPMARLYVNVMAERNGQRHANRSNVAARRGIEWITDAELEQVTREAVERTMILFEAGRPPAGEMPVVLASGPSGILLHEAIGHGMEADFNRKGTSIYADMIGQKVAEDFVTIVDDGTLEHERGALNVDDEGNPGQRTVLVDRGRLRTYMHDAISARHYGVAPTGSGRRQSFRHVVMPRMRCTFMEDGPHSRGEIIASVENGILAETFTNGQVQIGAGDYTFYIKNGYLIENGQLTRPIKDINIIGNGPETLRRITMAAADGHLDTGGWTCGKNGQTVPVSQGIPTVLVSRLTVGGENA
ncbi:MAG: metallopeptidase TldD-related protein [Myxococcota bacterium]